MFQATLTDPRTGALITVWDAPGEPDHGAALVYRWNGYAETASVRSLLQYVEAHGDRLRQRYVGWVHDLGESRINGVRLIDCLAFEDGFSYWWMTLIAEQSLWKSPIGSAIRFLALEEIIVEQRPAAVRLVSPDRCLNEALSACCASLTIEYEWTQTHSPRELEPRSTSQALPLAVQALVSLVRRWWTARSLGRAGKPRWYGGDSAVLFCSYFINFDRVASANGRFESSYWDGLPTLLHDRGYQTNWLEHYLRSDLVPDPESAARQIERFNQRPREQGVHAFPEAYLSWALLRRVVTRWFALARLSRRISDRIDADRAAVPRSDVWPFMRACWHESMRGSTAVANLLSLELFDVALRDCPPQRTGVYLCENQPWERALIRAWRKHGHGRLIAVPHATIRFWDLRYFHDSRTMRTTAPHSVPQPDLTALNGCAAVEAYSRSDVPNAATVECEALRYLYLADRPAARPRERAADESIRVLVLTDFLPSATHRMLRLLEAAAPEMPARATYTVKPHASFTVKVADYPSLRLTLVTETLAALLDGYDVVYASNMTSAAVDAHLSGVPVVVMLDETDLNVSPLRGHAGVRFAGTFPALAEALRAAAGTSPAPVDRDAFFFLDAGLPRWLRLLTDAQRSAIPA